MRARYGVSLMSATSGRSFTITNCCVVCIIVLYLTAIYRESMITRNDTSIYRYSLWRWLHLYWKKIFTQARTHTHNLDYTISLLPSMMNHYNDVIIGAMASQITSRTIVYSTVYSGTDQRKHQSSASLAFVRGINRRPVNSPHTENVFIWWRHHVWWIIQERGDWLYANSILNVKHKYIEYKRYIYRKISKRFTLVRPGVKWPYRVPHKASLIPKRYWMILVMQV